MLLRATKIDGCVARQTITEQANAGSFNFPKVAHSSDKMYLTFTQPFDAEADFSTIRMVTLSD